MRCPRCVQVIHRAADLCPHCGFHIQIADSVFELQNKCLRFLTDDLGLFRASEKDRIQEQLLRFQKRFPQLYFAVYTGSFGNHERMREFGFWLLNRAEFTGKTAETSDQGGVLLLLDPDLKAANVTYGYLLEPFINEDDTFQCLSRAHAYWLQDSYTEGVLKCVDQFKSLLVNRSIQAKTFPWKWAAKRKRTSIFPSEKTRIRPINSRKGDS